eukprot:TRINITY_DN13833_c0_g1_i1.p1 TRINITY_DN13833_c0_g1~~TRINITY_DN13833_c0_g1_i1.p1  ORF type:complete len:1453 (+),score=295.36 TRINITY_DN13833_c0_g1_i1:20-4378(+)
MQVGWEEGNNCQSPTQFIMEPAKSIGRESTLEASTELPRAASAPSITLCCPGKLRRSSGGCHESSYSRRTSSTSACSVNSVSSVSSMMAMAEKQEDSTSVALASPQATSLTQLQERQQQQQPQQHHHQQQQQQHQQQSPPQQHRRPYSASSSRQRRSSSLADLRTAYLTPPGSLPMPPWPEPGKPSPGPVISEKQYLWIHDHRKKADGLSLPLREEDFAYSYPDVARLFQRQVKNIKSATLLIPSGVEQRCHSWDSIPGGAAGVGAGALNAWREASQESRFASPQEFALDSFDYDFFQKKLTASQHGKALQRRPRSKRRSSRSIESSGRINGHSLERKRGENMQRKPNLEASMRRSSISASSTVQLLQHAQSKQNRKARVSLWKVADKMASAGAIPEVPLRPQGQGGAHLTVEFQDEDDRKSEITADPFSPMRATSFSIDSSKFSSFSGGRKPFLRRSASQQTDGGWTKAALSLSAAALGDLAEVCPRSPEQFLARLEAATDGFSRIELSLMRRSFMRYTHSDSFEVEKKALLDVFIHLGYLGPVDLLSETILRYASEATHFPTVNFEELQEIAEKVSAEESVRIKEAFDAALSNLKGDDIPPDERRLPDCELPPVLRQLGFCPLNRTMSEILARLRLPSDSDADISDAEDDLDLEEKEVSAELSFDTDVDFDDFKQFLAAYRASEGFGREMLSLVRSTFKTAIFTGAASTTSLAAAVPEQSPGSIEHFLRPEMLLSPLLRLFGRQAEPIAKAMLLKSGIEINTGGQSSDASSEKSRKSLGINLPDFLIWCRRLRDLRLEPLWHRFNAVAVPASTSVEPPPWWRGPIQKKLVVPAPILANSMRTSEGDNHDNDCRLSAYKQNQDGGGSSAAAAAAEAAAARMPSMTISQAAVVEFLEKANLENEQELDFDSFVRFAQACWRRSGFSQNEVRSLEAIFSKFDHDNSGELEAMEFLDLLRYLGHDTCLEDVCRKIAMTDSDSSGTLDFQEFLLQMRLHREEEWVRIRKVFHSKLLDWKASRKVTGAQDQLAIEVDQDDRALKPEGLRPSEVGERLPRQMLQSALHALGVLPEGEEKTLERILADMDWPEDLDVEGFANLEERCRVDLAANQRRHAGFSSPQLEVIRCLFQSYKESEEDALNVGELLWLLTSIGVQVDTHETRDSAWDLLESSRKAALQAGVSPEDVGDLGSTMTTFWALVHLIRALCRRREGNAADKEQKAVDECRFSRAEVIDFRQIFLARAQRHYSDPILQPASREVRKASKGRCKVTASASVIAELIEGAGLARKPWMAPSDMKSLLAYLGVTMTSELRQEVNEKVAEITGPQASRIDFADFLHLMRWMIDSNFADVNGAAEKVVTFRTRSEAAAAARARARIAKKARRKMQAALAVASAAKKVGGVLSAIGRSDEHKDSASWHAIKLDASIPRLSEEDASPAKQQTQPRWPLRVKYAQNL